jgi:hypothetical protein
LSHVAASIGGKAQKDDDAMRMRACRFILDKFRKDALGKVMLDDTSGV